MDLKLPETLINTSKSPLKTNYMPLDIFMKKHNFSHGRIASLVESKQLTLYAYIGKNYEIRVHGDLLGKQTAFAEDIGKKVSHDGYITIPIDGEALPTDFLAITLFSNGEMSLLFSAQSDENHHYMLCDSKRITWADVYLHKEEVSMLEEEWISRPPLEENSTVSRANPHAVNDEERNKRYQEKAEKLYRRNSNLRKEEIARLIHDEENKCNQNPPSPERIKRLIRTNHLKKSSKKHLK